MKKTAVVLTFIVGIFFSGELAICGEYSRWEPANGYPGIQFRAKCSRPMPGESSQYAAWVIQVKNLYNKKAEIKVKFGPCANCMAGLVDTFYLAPMKSDVAYETFNGRSCNEGIWASWERVTFGN